MTKTQAEFTIAVIVVAGIAVVNITMAIFAGVVALLLIVGAIRGHLERASDEKSSESQKRQPRNFPHEPPIV